MGYNGEGKTNLIDAVHYLCFGKSYFSATDKKVLKWESDFFRLEGQIISDQQTYKIKTKVKPGKLKEITIDGKKVPKMAEMIGRFPIIAIAPKEIYSLLLTSEARRKIIDQVISQFDSDYLKYLIHYNALLQRRNAILKKTERFHHLDMILLEMMDTQISEAANLIFERRTAFASKLIPLFESYYQLICSEKEIGTVSYQSQLQKSDLKALLKESLEKDFHLKRTTVGIHKDDYIFKLDSQALNAFGSQGQMKTYVIALKISLFSLLKEHRNLSPILLLDDIFDKFDQLRTKELLKLIVSDSFGQIFITDANKSMIADILDSLSISYKKYIVENGSVNEK